jgi:hypothetical protein
LSCLLLAAPATAAAATPRDELLRYVPDDVGFCLVLQDLRGHAADLAHSPFVAQLRDSPLGATIRGAQELTRLDALEARLKKHLGVDFAQLRDDVLGDALVFAYRPGPPGKPDEEQGLILVRARTARALADLVDRLNKAQKESHELQELEEREHHGTRYYKRVDHKGTGYYSLRGPVLLYSGEEEMLRAALDRERVPAEKAEPAVARALREFGADRALLALWVNPRALDAEVESGGKRTEDEDPEDENQVAVRKTVVACWKALDALVLTVDLGRDLSVSLGVQARPEKLPPGVRRFLDGSAHPSELWRAFPDNALVALALRVQASALFGAAGDFLTPQGRRSLRADLNRGLGAAVGKDFVNGVLPAVGPDFGLCVLAPSPGEKGWFPQVLVALRVAPGDELAAPVDQAILTALHVGAWAAVVAYNREHPGRTLVLLPVPGKPDVKFLSGDKVLPPGLQPALGLRDGYLVLASSFEVLDRFRLAGPAPDPAAGIPLLRVSFKECRAYLKERRAELARALAEKSGATPGEVEGKLDGLLAGLEFIDRLELRQRTAPGQVVFTLSLQPAQPLKK